MPKKAQRSIPSGEWGSQVSKYPADSDLVNLNDLTADSKNYDTHEKGVLTKRKGSVQYSTLSNPAADQYEAIFSDGIRHLITVQNGTVEHSTGDGVTNSVVNGVGFSTAGNFEFTTVTDRVYMGNGINAGQVYDKTAVYGGAAPATVPRLKTMGCQVPSTPCVAAIGAAGNVPAVGHTYKVTYIYYGLEESNGNTTSNLVTPGVPSIINLTSVPIGGYGVTSRKIYRDDNNGLYRLVGEVSDNTTTIFADNVAVGTAVIPTDNEIPPVFGQIVSFLDRSWLADIVGEPHTVRHSEAGLPNIFRSTNYIVCNERDPITAIIVFLDRIIVFNRNSMGQILGKTSDEFRYAEIQSSVGCVDSRTVQTRIIRGVPHLVWLSDKGIYVYNGNSIEYASEPIEDLVNFNIQQGVQTRGQNSQTSQADFQAGTASDGIDLTSNPGTISTPEPQKLWNDQAEWEAGNLANVSTKNTSNKIQVPQWLIEEPGVEGSKSGVVADGNNIKLDTSDDWTGDSKAGTYNPGYLNIDVNPDGIDDLAIPIKVPRNGIITGFQITVKMRSGVATSYPYVVPVHLDIWDNAGGAPGSRKFNFVTSVTFPNFTPAYEFTLNTGVISHSLNANTVYWLIVRLSPDQQGGGRVLKIDNAKIVSEQYEGAGAYAYGRYNDGTWQRIEHSQTNDSIGNVALSYSFNSSPTGKSGQWLSSIQDSKSANPGTIIAVEHDATYPALTSAISTLEGSDSEDFSGGAEVSENTANLNGSYNTALSGKRYWRFRVQLDTTDDRFTPTVETCKIKFNTTATWISEGIDCTGDDAGSTDCTAYNSLDIINNIPSGTTVSMTVRTATTEAGLTAAPWVAFGVAVVRQWFQVRVIMTLNTTTNETPDVTSIDFKYTIVANLVSSVINTGATPAGWDIFQESSTLNGGTLVFQMRTDDNPGMASPTAWTAVTSGVFPAIAPEQYVQWKAIFTSTSGNVPEVDAVVINWLVSSSDPIRAASLFYDKHYYLAAAKFGSDVNNIVIILDPNNKWRVWEDININTLSLFFNIPYYGDANAGKMLKMFEGNLDLGITNIPIDVRMKADDFSDKYTDNRDKQKVMRDVVITGKNTGATYTFYYSIDVGATWTALKDDTGATSFTTSSNNGRFTKRFKADHSQNSPITGRTIMIRATSNDENNVELHKFKVRVFVRKGEPLG